ncbi:hypothetical protein AVEN_164199-1 [Araneus ventricosus]|uniref:Uncharacterized protein n=1 Tax=Araneus ventricosus TaxID=182803 RepID=A0A4Y2JQH2_ARAVE|nr:hypothetical protein AVEN_164199-1 [Araneus ventricosus]
MITLASACTVANREKNPCVLLPPTSLISGNLIFYRHAARWTLFSKRNTNVERYLFDKENDALAGTSLSKIRHHTTAAIERLAHDRFRVTQVHKRCGPSVESDFQSSAFQS